MTCQELADFILDFVEGRLPEDQHEVFEKHLSVCPSCVAYIRSYKSTCEILGALGCSEEEERPREVPEQLIQAILKSRALGEPGTSGTSDQE